MAEGPAILRKTLLSVGDAEDFLVKLWIGLEKHGVKLPGLTVDAGFGLTVTIKFHDCAEANVMVDELGSAAL
jgi:hypothetical protein